MALTIDMCPSSRGFSQNIYTALLKRARLKTRPLPVGVAMTRSWMKRWPQHFKKIKKYQSQGFLSVTWINHSANHIYRKNKPLINNFLLIKGTDMNDEVMGNEISLIESGVTPSSYFRFPGLVSNRQTIDFVSNHGLITLGSQAWLGKNETPSFGPIILIHGNKNEPVGETKLLNYITTMDTKGHEFGSLDEALNPPD